MSEKPIDIMAVFQYVGDVVIQMADISYFVQEKYMIELKHRLQYLRLYMKRIGDMFDISQDIMAKIDSLIDNLHQIIWKEQPVSMLYSVFDEMLETIKNAVISKLEKEYKLTPKQVEYLSRCLDSVNKVGFYLGRLRRVASYLSTRKNAEKEYQKTKEILEKEMERMSFSSDEKNKIEKLYEKFLDKFAMYDEKGLSDWLVRLIVEYQYILAKKYFG